MLVFSSQVKSVYADFNELIERQYSNGLFHSFSNLSVFLMESYVRFLASISRLYGWNLFNRYFAHPKLMFILAHQTKSCAKYKELRAYFALNTILQTPTNGLCNYNIFIDVAPKRNVNTRLSARVSVFLALPLGMVAFQ